MLVEAVELAVMEEAAAAATVQLFMDSHRLFFMPMEEVEDLFLSLESPAVLAVRRQQVRSVVTEPMAELRDLQALLWQVVLAVLADPRRILAGAAAAALVTLAAVEAAVMEVVEL
jgi:hypothetical protein